jgi:hypothetical protein
MQQQKQEDAEDDRSGRVPNRVHQLWFVNVGHACPYSTVGRITKTVYWQGKQILWGAERRGLSCG